MKCVDEKKPTGEKQRFPLFIAEETEAQEAFAQRHRAGK